MDDPRIGHGHHLWLAAANEIGASIVHRADAKEYYPVQQPLTIPGLRRRGQRRPSLQESGVGQVGLPGIPFATSPVTRPREAGV